MYLKSLKNDYWEKVKRQIKIRDNHKCRICESKVMLEIHHITYYVNGKSIKGNELEYKKWIITLCNSCHKKVHLNPSHKLNPNNYLKVSSNDYK